MIRWWETLLGADPLSLAVVAAIAAEFQWLTCWNALIGNLEQGFEIELGGQIARASSNLMPKMRLLMIPIPNKPNISAVTTGFNTTFLSLDYPPE
jgi:hypothetical protein